MNLVKKLYERLFAGNGLRVVRYRKPALASYLRRTGIFFLLPLTFYLFSFSSLHPYYISITEFNHNAAEKTVQVTAKFFADDLEEALKQELKQSVSILSAADKKKNEAMMNQYLKSHLQLKIDGRATEMKMIGHEIEQESVWIYLEVKNIPGIKKAEVMNNALYSLRESQVNIIHFTNGGKRKSYRLSNPDKQTVFSW